MSFLGEIKRRKAFQVAATFAVVAWLIVQVVATIEGPLGLPGWFDTVVIVLLMIGFPITLIVSWAFNITTEGLVKDEGRDAMPAENHRRIEFALLGLLAVAIAWIGYRELGPSAEAPAERVTNSVAVLPFQNLSLDPENAFFAAGIHEEVLNQLAKLRNLRVTSRTSVLRFEDTDLPIPEIATQLNVRNVLEGSVRYADGRVRITAQLIDARSDEHLWSDIYERDMSDIFSIQADIAMNIANSLAAEFSPEEADELDAIPTNSIEAYEFYLASLAEYRPLTTWDVERCLELIEAALAIDPEFALAWAHKGEIHLSSTLNTPAAELRRIWSLADEAARRAVELDPDLDAARVLFARTASWVGDMNTAEAQFRRADIRGTHADKYSEFLLSVGKSEAAAPYLAQAKINDPLNPVNTLFTAIHLSIAGETDAARAELERGLELFGDDENPWIAGHWNLTPADAEEGRFDSFSIIMPQAPVDDPAALLRSVRTLVDAGAAPFTMYQLTGAVAAGLGDFELALQAAEIAIAQVTTASFTFWRPAFREMRLLPGFKELMQRHGFVDYWREYGWPDLCRPLGEQDFECF